ncbi:hypothetical protein B0H14DRAFT_2754344 [Mycena olivaceomarginata]|nr:hypothetical protein B0H14DRAFT_2754344 [Mycena olivaceomarginata]
MVPQELLDDMFVDLDEDSLRACALASRRFLLPAQRLLFKEMSFPMQQNFRGESKGISNPITLLVQRASDILSSSPQLLAFVRELNVGSMYWKEGWEALEVLLRTLRPGKIECFSMEGAMEAIASGSAMAFRHLYWWLHFASCRNVVVRCNTLQVTTTIDAASPASRRATTVPLPPAIHAGDGDTLLECLAMRIRHGAGDFLVQPTISRLISGLCKLEIFADALGAVHFCSRTLTHLKLHIASEFPCLGALRVLTLEGTTSTWSIPMEFVAPSLPTSLPHLEVLNVNTLLGGTRMAQAPALNAALTALASLREVNLAIYSAIGGGTELMHYRKSVEEELPALHDAGLLTFSQIGLDSTE